jgi:tetratricopeptide (TPR) repeat protein
VKSRIAISLLLAAAVFLSYGRILGFPFISIDDQVYVTENRHVLSGVSAEGLRWAITATDGGNWHPLTWFSHMLDAELYGPRPAGHRVTALLLHAANAVLVFWLLARGTGRLWPSALVAAIFALHPLRVESVAWASERKDLLSSLFGLASLAFYGRYVARPAAGAYLAALFLFACSLMAKPMLVTLPLLMMILDFWPLGRLTPPSGKRFTALLLEKIPFGILSLAISLITLATQTGALTNPGTLPPGPRLGNAVESAVAYLGALLWPADLSFIYPHPGPIIHPWPVVGGGLVLLTITVAAGRSLSRRPWLAAGWLWYLVSLLPVIGIVQAGRQSMADRYTYLPLLGPTLILIWLAAEVAASRRIPSLLVAGGVAPLLLLTGTLTWRQTGHWRDSDTLYRHADAVVRDNWVARYYLGDLRLAEGRNREAIDLFLSALAIKPDDPILLIDLGIAYRRIGLTEEAIASFSRVIARNPEHAEAHYNLGLIMAEAGRREEAFRLFREALDRARGNPRLTLDIGTAFLRRGNPGQAASILAEAVRLNPSSAAAHHNLASALAALGRVEEAILHYREAVRLDPEDKNGFNNLGIALADAGKGTEALSAFLRALALDPLFEDARHNLAEVRWRMGQGGGQ